MGSRSVERLADFLLGVLALGLVSCGQTRANGAPRDSGQPTGGSSTGASGGDSGSPGGAADDGSAVGYEPSGAPIYTRAQRLTNSQFEHAARDILRLPQGTDLKSSLVAPVAGTTTFTNNERVLTMDEETVRAFESAAEKAAALATSSPEALSRLYSGTDAAGLVRDLGRRAFRRPLSEDEEARYLAMFARGEELYGPGFSSGAALVIRAMLSSPHFLYRTELGPAGEPLSGHELAAKLSLWLLDTTPNEELLDAADAGELVEDEPLLTTARAMLEQPEAALVMREFHAQLYELDRFDDLAKPSWPDLDQDTAAEAKEASRRFFDRLFGQDLRVREIFTSARGFVGPRLAPLYAQPFPSEMEERALGPERIGYFMQAPALMVTSHEADPDIVQRGAALARQALCAQVPFPTSTIPPLPPIAPGQTNRQRVADWTEGCGLACHQSYLNPLGFAFEGFDAMGAARTSDHGQPIDASGRFSFSAGASDFVDARELMTKLADDEQVYACYGQKLAGYGLQRDLVAEDLPLIEALGATGRGGTSKDVALALVRHPAFRLRRKDLP